ncbi:MAG: restriction endonuclease subunit S [Clostridia bacterium]|nr:restriction endonuclease subunit S [Clostridia bacterium]
MAKKQEKSIEQRLEEALVLYEKTPYSLPSNWCWTRLGTVCKLDNGEKIDKEELFYLDVKTLRTQNYELTKNNGVIVNEGQRVILVDGENSGEVFDIPKHGYMGSTFRILDIDKTLNEIYVRYFISSHQDELRNNKIGSAIPHLNKELFFNLSFPLAPLEEQQRIVGIIEKQFAKLDEARDLIQKSLDSFVDRKSAILHKAFTGELTKKWREEHRLDNAVEISKRLNLSRFQELSFGWLKINAQDACCEKISCGHTPTQDILEHGEIPFLKVYNIVDNKIDFEYRPQFINLEANKKLKSSELKPNDIVMNIVGPPLRKIAIIPGTYQKWNMNQAIVRFRAKEYIIPKFLYYLLLWPNTLDDVISKTKGVVGQANISVTQSRNLDFIIPSRQEQEEIVRILDSIFEKEDKSKELIDMLDKIDEMKKSILACAFRGELGTSNTADEPAIDLLKRILENKKGLKL